MASKLIARSLVNINLTGSETEQFKVNARKAEDLLVSDIADSRGDRYGPQRLKFCAFCASNGRESLPSLPDTIVVYLTSVAEKGLGSVLMARAAIRYFNLKYDSATTSPSDDKKVSCLVLALKRKMGKHVTKREPINHECLLKLLKFYLPEGIHSDELLIKFCWANFYSVMYFVVLDMRKLRISI